MNLDKFMGCIMAIGVCDAFGVPFETMTPDEIEILELVGYTLDGYFCPSINPHPFPDVVGKSKGSWSDDTQLTLVTMESLIESNGKFDMEILARKHVDAYKVSAGRGWGKSTRNSCQRLLEEAHWTKSGEPHGEGNGIMMKISPMGLRESMCAKAPEEFIRLRFLKECIDYARMTHRSFAAVAAGCVHAYAVYFLARQTSHELPNDFLENISAYAIFTEQYLSPETPIYRQIALLSAMKENGSLARETPRQISMRFGGGTKAAFSAINSLGTSYAAFLRNPQNFDCIADCIRMGGDTDSNAAITGSLLGALHGISIIPEKFIEEMENSGSLREKIKEFYNTCIEK
ncbi:MAG: ADP-ribosylglycohydrolase family protein [Candidatus Sungbacteria bacterium]|nr:ADP-ribosylglycohydrolase family protein [Candidatus Sungbacteria bacterium]